MACKYFFNKREFSSIDELVTYMNKRLSKQPASRPIQQGIEFQHIEGHLNTNEVFLPYFGSQGRPTNGQQILQTLAETGANDEIKELAASLLSSMGEMSGEIPVLLQSLEDWKAGDTVMTKTGPVVLMQNRTWSNKEDFETTLLHELIHGASKNFIRTNPEHKDVLALLDLQLDVLDMVRKGEIDTDVLGTFGEDYSTLLYALTGQKVRSVEDIDESMIDPVEVITYALAEPEFKELLKTIKVKNTKKTWWGRIVESIRSFLGISSPSKVSATMLDKMTAASHKVLNTAREYSYEYEGEDDFSARPRVMPAKKLREESLLSMDLKENPEAQILQRVLKGEKINPEWIPFDAYKKKISKFSSDEGTITGKDFKKPGIAQETMLNTLGGLKSKSDIIETLESKLGIDPSHLIEKDQILKRGKTSTKYIDEVKQGKRENRDPKIMEDHVKRVNEAKMAESPEAQTAKESILSDLEKNKDSRDPYDRTSVVSEKESYSFRAGAHNAVNHVIEEQKKWTSTHRNKLVVHSNDVTGKNKIIRSELFGGNPDIIEQTDILYVGGHYVRVKFVEDEIITAENTEGDPVGVSMNVKKITLDSGRVIKLVTSVNSSEETLADGIKLLGDPEAFAKKEGIVFMEDPGVENYTPLTYGYAMSPDMMTGHEHSIVIDEDSFYTHSNDNQSANTLLKTAFERTNNITVFSGRITEDNTVNENDTTKQDKEYEAIMNDILNPDGTLDNSNFGEDYTKKARQFAVDGMVEILQTGSIAITAEQIRNTPGLPKGLSTMPYFIHKGRVYINKDMVGEGAIINELNHLFLDHIRKDKPELFRRLMNLARDSSFIKEIRKNMPDADELEVEMATFIYMTEASRESTGNVSGELKGTLNEFINSVDEQLKNIDEDLSPNDKLTKLALAINRGIMQGKFVMHRMLLQPDVDAASFDIGFGGLSMQITDMVFDLINKGKIIKTCE